MPLVRISLIAGKPDAQKRKIADAAHRALVETISIPAQDRFQIMEVRKSLFKRLADLLHEEAGIRREDVFVNLVETAKENWSFGNGIAQYAT
jgi:4-oxalocrotonate tautomerase